ncbi:MAG: PH domain-containing protein [Spirochaetota bacterium]|jgi:hypothetical protein|nr:PH domain-containing protein [Spirochaetales bacterium]MEE1289441.1 PH domain-containing protein [Spirochaetota bacterium]
MIDFNNCKLIKMKKVASTPESVTPLLIPNEEIIGIYQAIRDFVVFTNKRVISVNVQGLTGKKKDFTTLPYSKIQAFSIETAGTFDLDSELDLVFSGLGRVRFEFTGNSDIVAIGKLISSYIL